MKTDVLGKKRTDELTRINALVTTDWIERLDDWRRRQPRLPTISESIRKLVEVGLDHAEKTAQKRR